MTYKYLQIILILKNLELLISKLVIVTTESSSKLSVVYSQNL